jgi:hypothetical protein
MKKKLGDSETWMSEGTVEEAEKALKDQKSRRSMTCMYNIKWEN